MTTDKGGAPEGNANATKHGIRGFLCGGKLPKGASYIRKQVNRYRRAIEAEIIDLRGEITITEASIVQTVTRHEIVCQLATRWLRHAENGKVTVSKAKTAKTATVNGKPATAETETTKTEGLTFEQRLAALKAIASHSESRDRCLEKLALKTGKTASPFDGIYNGTLPEPINDTPAAPESPQAATGHDSPAEHPNASQRHDDTQNGKSEV